MTTTPADPPIKTCDRCNSTGWIGDERQAVEIVCPECRFRTMPLRKLHEWAARHVSYEGRNPCVELRLALKANVEPPGSDDGGTQEPVVVVRDHEAKHKCGWHGTVFPLREACTCLSRSKQTNEENPFGWCHCSHDTRWQDKIGYMLDRDPDTLRQVFVSLSLEVDIYYRMEMAGDYVQIMGWTDHSKHPTKYYHILSTVTDDEGLAGEHAKLVALCRTLDWDTISK